MRTKLLNIDKKKGKAFLRHNNVMIRNNQYGYLKQVKEGRDKITVFIPCGSEVRVNYVLTDLETYEKTLILVFYDSAGQGIEIPLKRSEMTEQNITSLTRYGVQVSRNTANILIQCLENDEADAPVSYHHHKTGFTTFNDEEIFKGHEIIGSIASEYSGELKIEPKGSMDEWLNMVEDEVLGTPMEVVLASALSATVIDYVYQEYPVDNLLMSLVGNSSSGKTTALSLAVSAGAFPATTENSLMLTFFDTEASIMHRIASAFPVGIDEASVLSKNVTRLLYALGNGKERARMRKDLAMAESAEFHTAVFMSSERSILSLADSNAGLRVRLMEFTNIEWTKDAHSADRIKKTCLNNYGWAVPAFAEYLLSVEKTSVIDCCQEWTEEYLQERGEDIDSPDNALIVRMAKRVGIILAAAYISEFALGFKMNTELIKNFFLDNLLVDSSEYDIGIQAYDILVDYVTENPSDFGYNPYESGVVQSPRLPSYYKNGYFKITREVTTLYDGSKSSEILYIKKETFSKILQNKGFQDSKVVLRRLKELGLLISEKDRYVSHFKLGLDAEAYVVGGYKIRIRTEDKEEAV